MADTTISTETVMRNGFTFRGPDSRLTVTATGSLTSLERVAVTSSFENTRLALYGNLRSEVTSAIGLSGTNADVYIGYGVSVSSAGTHINDTCVAMGGFFSELVNNGSITSAAAGGLRMSGVGSMVLTNGDISGVPFGVRMDQAHSTLTNNGTITASNGDYWTGAVVLAYDDGVLVNNGTISVTGTDTAGVLAWGGKGGFGAGGAGGLIENHGTIHADGGYGIVLRGLVASPSLRTVANTGLIEGSLGSFWGDQYANRVTNSGTMIGDVFLNEGNDVFDGWGGTVQGRILGGLGNDLYLVSDSAARITELAGEGRDSIAATVSFDLSDLTSIEKLTLLGGDAINATGNAEDNVLTGNSGANTLIGAGGYDTLAGRQGNDVLDGGEGEDVLIGGSGMDTLTGGAGDDRIDGGSGVDLMTGGGGADVFLFHQPADGRGAVRHDTITDFVSGQDRINLAAIDADSVAPGDQALDFIGQNSFAGLAGQVRYDAGILQVDLDGNGRADIEIVLTGAPLLFADDLSL